MCPGMPTVDSCPSGQEKYVTYESRECGTYYACRPQQYQEQYQSQDQYQQYQQQYIQEPVPTNYPTSPSPEEYCKQYPEKCEQMKQEYDSSGTYQLQSHYPTLKEFLLGLLDQLL